MKKSTQITKPKSLTLCDKITKYCITWSDKNHQTMQVWTRH